jgi:hypothetical protein
VDKEILVFLIRAVSGDGRAKKKAAEAAFF